MPPSLHPGGAQRRTQEHIIHIVCRQVKAVSVMPICMPDVLYSRRCAPPGCNDIGGGTGGVVAMLLRPRLTMLRPSGVLCGRIQVGSG